jgi:hypothetical protein
MKILFSIFFIIFAFDGFAEDFDMEIAFSKVRENCASINDDLQKMKNLATADTVVSAVGTGTSVGALATGIAKKKTDEDAEEIEINLEHLYKIEAETPCFAANQDYDAFLDSLPDYLDADEVMKKYSSLSEAIESEEKRLQETTDKSKKLGDWRTGLLAGSTATAIAGTAISATNKADEDFIKKIDNCAKSVDKLQDYVIANKTMGKDVSYYQQVVKACQDYKYVDLSLINKHAIGALVSSAVAMTSGITGTIISAVANGKDIRDDNTSEGKEKEKKLNTSSNVLAAGTGIASASSTIFSALQIKEIKKVMNISEQCSNILK